MEPTLTPRPLYHLPDAVLTAACGLVITRTTRAVDGPPALAALIARVADHPGAVFACGHDAPGRYRRHATGFADPPLRLVARDTAVRLEALNPRGEVLLAALAVGLEAGAGSDYRLVSIARTLLRAEVLPGPAPQDESLRTRRASVFSLLRGLLAALATPGEAGPLGLHGAFGYDLVLQFEEIARRLPRAEDQRDLVLYLADRHLFTDPVTGEGREVSYDFEFAGRSTAGLRRATAPSPYDPEGGRSTRDHAPGAYRATVETARAAFARGDLFEVVPGQQFTLATRRSPAAIFGDLCRDNPAPYGALLNLGEGEFLVSASPEMFVRCDGRRIETCPISGTIPRGRDAAGDAEAIRTLLNSDKDHWELNMCTDVDRNDKARICAPGSVKILARRQIETYSRLFHTVDHVEGRLGAGFDALDGFLTHCWAVTVTGAPKLHAMRFLEAHEASARRWYGGAFGGIDTAGRMDTGLTLRTIRMKAGVAEIRVGATLLHDSDPAAEEAECETKAAALVAAIEGLPRQAAVAAQAMPIAREVLLVDHEDSFVHMLAGSLRAEGARVTVVRHDRAAARLAAGPRPDLLVLSPGPARPQDFGMGRLIDQALAMGLPIFGVCLGMQGLGEHFGARLAQLPRPAHGRGAEIRALDGQGAGGLLAGLPRQFAVGRYHSLHLAPESLPACLALLAVTEEGCPMAVAHRTLPVAAVQFHPESLMSMAGGAGARILRNVLAGLCAPAGLAAGAEAVLLPAE